MKDILKNRLTNPFIKTITAGGVTQSIMIFSGLIINKIIAVLIGPSGTMLYGQFNNLFQIASNFSTFFSENGIIKIVSENKSEEKERKLIFSTSLRILLLTSFCGGILIIIFSNFLSKTFFLNYQFRNEIIFFGISIFFIGLNGFSFALLNAFNEIKKISYVRIFQSVLTLFLSSYLCWIYGISGVIISVIISQYLIFIYTLFLLKKTYWFRIHDFFSKINKNYLKKILKFSLMGITATLSTFITIKIRSLLTDSFDTETAGLWDGMLKISNGYLAIVISSISLYYLPKLSSLKKEEEIKKEIINGFKTLLPIMLIVTGTLYVFRTQIITLLYTSEYSSISDFFFPQLLGDFIKITAQCLAYLMIAKAMTRLFIFSEIYFSIQYLVIVWFFVSNYGIIGVFWGYTINTFIYLMFMILRFKKYLF